MFLTWSHVRTRAAKDGVNCMIWVSDRPSKSKITQPPVICVVGSSIDAAIATWTARNKSTSEHLLGFHFSIKKESDKEQKKMFAINLCIFSKWINNRYAALTSALNDQNTWTVLVACWNQFDKFLLIHMNDGVWIQIFIQIGMFLFKFEECLDLKIETKAEKKKQKKHG